jgi:ubiquinone/menaquinone biosynthesis C-methylase UbiE
MAHVCPWWLGYLLASPLRKLLQDPDAILTPVVEPGMSVLEIGPGMGFFSLPLARRVGAQGRVVCLDIQPKMLERLGRRAEKAGLRGRIETRLCPPHSFGLAEHGASFDFALLFAVLHEMPDQDAVWKQLHDALKPTGKVLFAEPRGHVDARRFEASLSQATSQGFATDKRLTITRSHAAVLRRV